MLYNKRTRMKTHDHLTVYKYLIARCIHKQTQTHSYMVQNETEVNLKKK